MEEFDLDVQVTKAREDDAVKPNITSHFLCTPGCGDTGSFNSYCC